MKHFMQPRNTILKDTNLPSSADTPPSIKHKSSSNRKQKVPKENAPPPSSDLISHSDHSSPSHTILAGKPSPAAAAKLKSPLPPRPPPSNPLKRKLCLDTVAENGAPVFSDSGVKVIVRMRPPTKDEEEGEIIVQKLSGNSISILGQTFTFDSVAGADSRQIDVFELVGAPLVENCLAGFNSSVFAYGQTGSGKTYTIWGPANALLDKNLSSEQQGLTPRVFERLFSRVEEEQKKNSDKQLMYQCRCSFLEIYNEQITDLLDPTQRNLQIREDIKTGVYVENLTEECVGTMKDVTQLLLKGLSNRRTGATSINAESSRSHSVFTCVVESRCMSVADGVSCFKTSRINLVDLAGSERQKLTGAAGERLKEAGNINRSLSQLGNLINILAEVSQTGKQRHIPYRDSKLTFLLQESLGGNAKLAMVCAISPVQSCKSETLSTLRFAQRAKAIKNKAVVNEEMHDDVNVLREVIRQLKDELVRMKANGSQTEPNGGYSTGWNARRSLSLLKFSLNRPMVLPHVDVDGDEEMEIVEEAEQLGILLAGSEEKRGKRESLQFRSLPLSPKAETRERLLNMSSSAATEEDSENVDVDVKMEEVISEEGHKNETLIIHPGQSGTRFPGCSKSDVLDHSIRTEGAEDEMIDSSDKALGDSSGKPSNECLPSESNLQSEVPLRKPVESPRCPSLEVECIASADNNENVRPYSPNGAEECHAANLSIVPCEISPVLKSPTPSLSPRVSSSSWKSLRTSSILTASQKDLIKSNVCSEGVNITSAKPSKSICLNAHSTRTSKVFERTEHLAASLHRGLEILDSNRKSSAFRRSSFRFSYKPVEIKPISIQKVDVGVQTLHQDYELVEAECDVILCSNCKSRTSHELKDGNNNSYLQLVPVDGSQSTGKSKKLVPKAVEKVLAGAIRREMALEEFCANQTSEIKHLNRLVQQYKHERECNAIIGETREDKISRLESLMDGVLSTKEFIEDELICLTNEHKILKEKYENHPEVLRTKIELKRVQDELECYRNFFDMGERDVLLEEIQDLRNQLQDYIDSSPLSAQRRNPILQLTYSCDPSVSPPLCPIPESTDESAEQRLERERILWTEAESKWISLAEELRFELEANRSLAEKQRQELEMEKKCSEDLKEAMQMAMEGHARMLEQYADLEEKHIQMLARQRRMQDGVEDVKKAAAKAGVKGAESKFINALAAEISALKVEREKERRHYRDENKGLQAQLRDTAEALQAAGELLVRLKEAEEAVAAAEMRSAVAEQETEKAYKLIKKLKKTHENEITTFHQLLAESRLPQEATVSPPVYDSHDRPKFDGGVQHWREEFEPFSNVEEGEVTKLGKPSSWFSGYDRCNI